MAIGEYQRLVREYPNSPLVDDAQYKIGECYYEISPNFRLDQEYTKKAITEFMRFIENYPNSELVSQALEKIRDLNNKLARKDFEAAKQYKRLKEYNAAIIYYDYVIQNFPDSKYVIDAYFHKGECLYELEEYAAAKEIFESFIRLFPNHQLIKDAREYIEELNNTNLISNEEEK